MPTRLETPVATLPEPIHAWRTWTLVGSRDGSRVRLAPIAGHTVVFDHGGSTLSYEVGPGGRIFFSDFDGVNKLVRR